MGGVDAPQVVADEKPPRSVGGALSGQGVSVMAFVQLVVVAGTVLTVARRREGEEAWAMYLLSPAALASLGALLAWVAPLKELAYVIDRVAAVRAQLVNMAPYGLDLLPTLPAMLPYTGMVIDNIERVGPFVPVMMQKGCKEYMVPLMPEILPDLEIMLDAAPLLAPVMPRIAPHLHRILPYTKLLLPHAEALVCIVEVEGWEVLNDYMADLAPCIDKVAPYTKDLAPYLPQMAPYMPILCKHMDNLIAEMDETVEVLDKLIPLLPLLPAADQAGLLSQRLAFKALPQVLRRSPLSNELTGRAALQGANIHTKVVDKLQEVQVAVLKRYQLYLKNGAAQIADGSVDPLAPTKEEKLAALDGMIEETKAA